MRTLLEIRSEIDPVGIVVSGAGAGIDLYVGDGNEDVTEWPLRTRASGRVAYGKVDLDWRGGSVDFEPPLQLDITKAIPTTKSGTTAQIRARFDMAEPRTGRSGTENPGTTSLLSEHF